MVGRLCIGPATMVTRKVVKELIAAGANVFAQTTDGWTALYVASYNGHSLVVKELTSAGADVRVRDSAGRTAVHWASNNGHSEVVKELIAAGANVDVQTKGMLYDAKMFVNVGAPNA
ncbi:putative ankyrin repeat protein L63 [Diplonema papillatum]|nr:putative ankyrin repeat protein L63 [Diplonema papillatum]